MEKKNSSNPWRGRVIAYAPLLFWLGVIFFLSGSLGSFNETSRFIGPLLNFLFPDASPETLRHYHGVVRKIAHVGLYAIYAVLAVRAMKLQYAPSLIHMVVLGLLLVLITASLDEMNQSFLTSRTGTPSDVLIDVAGGIVGLTLGLAFYNVRSRRSSSQPFVSARE